MDLSVNGPKIYFRIKLFDGYINITQTTITLLIVTLILIPLAYFIGKNLKKRPGRFQVIVEKLVTMLYNMV